MDDESTLLITPGIRTNYTTITQTGYNTSSDSGGSVSYLINQEELSVPDTDDPPQKPKTTINQISKVYKRRWYILLLYSLMCAVQSLICNTWSPISDSAQKAFGWNNGDISLLANWGPLTNVSVPFFAWMLDTKGLRCSIIVAMLFVTLGSGVRLIPTQQPSMLHKWLMNIGQLLNGLGGPVSCGAMTLLSATWFPPNERATATAIPFVSKFLALAGSFVLGPLLVPDISKENDTGVNFTAVSLDNSQRLNNNSGVTVKDLREDVTFYLVLETCIAAAVVLLILVYFPKKPPTPPCVSASVQRAPFILGVKCLLRNGNFWLIAFMFMLISGFGNAWMMVLSLILIPVGISQKEAGWIGFYALLSTSGVILICGRAGDYFSRHLKWFIFGLLFVAAAMYLCFALVSIKIIPFYKVCLYVFVIIGQTANNAPNPLVWELACDVAYPVGEGTSSQVLMGTGAACTAVFLLLMMIPNIGTMWLTWGIVGTMSLCVMLVLVIKEKHHRLEIDVVVQHDNKNK